MNINKFTIKSQEAIQLSQQMAQSFGQQQIENEHIFKAIFEVDENVAPFILKKHSRCSWTSKAIFSPQNTPSCAGITSRHSCFNINSV